MSKKGRTKVPGTYLLCRLAKKHLSPGVTGAASEHPLEGVAEDPAGAGFGCVPEGNDFEGGAGAEARGKPSPFI